MFEGLVNGLKNLGLNGNVMSNESSLNHHSTDESYHEASLPDAVVYPETTEDVEKVMKYAEEFEIPVVPYGLGTSLEGHVIPYEGGISLDMSLMNRIIDIRPEDFLVKVEPGVTRSQLNKELKKHGLFFSVDPGADATLGGMAATNASGTTSVKYGIMRDQVRDMRVVMSNGTTIHTGGLSAKSSSGLHLNGLMVGSEGTLGVITELTLKVYGIPEVIMAGRATFPSIHSSVNAVLGILTAGIPVARVELVDAVSINKVNIFSETDYDEKPTLFLEFHGNSNGLKQDIEFAKEIFYDSGCENISFETDVKGRNQLWEARHNLAYAFIHDAPGKKLMVTDVSLPLSSLTEAILDAREAVENSALEGAILGHVGDGNFHVLMMIDLKNREEVREAKELNNHIVNFALERGGTCTGEHGVGVGKAVYQQREHQEAYEVMRSIKQVLDPKNILNPGKIFLK